MLPTNNSSRAALRALCLPVIFGVAFAVGCNKRQPTAKENTAFVAHKIAQAQASLTARPPLPDAAREAALDALAIDEQSVPARLALVDALFLQKNYKGSLKELKPLDRRGVEREEVLYRKARGLYWFHSYGVRRNYTKAREAAEDCLKQGQRYLVECSTIIRNSYIGEAKGDPAKLRSAYGKAAENARALLTTLGPSHDAYGDTCLILAEYELLHLNRAGDGEGYLAEAKRAATTRPRLAERVAAFERERELRKVLANAAAQGN